jgi:uncharacterized protein YggL (DUF469 family)
MFTVVKAVNAKDNPGWRWKGLKSFSGVVTKKKIDTKNLNEFIDYEITLNKLPKEGSTLYLYEETLQLSLSGSLDKKTKKHKLYLGDLDYLLSFKKT